MLEIIEIPDSPPSSPKPCLRTVFTNHAPSQRTAAPVGLPARQRRNIQSEELAQKRLNNGCEPASNDPADLAGEATVHQGANERKSRLKIIFVDSGSNFRSGRSRRQATKKTSEQTDERDSDGGSDALGDTIRQSASKVPPWDSEVESDKDYEDSKEYPKKRRKLDRRRICARKPKYHAKLCLADKELVMRAEKGRPMYERGKGGPRKTLLSNAAKAGLFLKQLAARVDWGEAVSDLANMRLMGKDAKKAASHNPGLDDRSTVDALRLRQYLLDILTKSIMSMNTT